MKFKRLPVDRYQREANVEAGFELVNSPLEATTGLGLSNRFICERKEETEDVADSAADAAAVVELDQGKVGRLSRMDAMQGQAMAQASAERREQKLRLIDAAL